MAAANASTRPPVHHRSQNGTPLYETACDHCGAVRYVDKRRIGKLCHPCAMKARETHGLTNHPLYRVLCSIKGRCDYPSASNYVYYGGRGIGVCVEWREHPERFVEWAEERGWKPGMEVDRIDPDGGYSPENCRLLDHRRNSQRTRRIKTTPAQVVQVREALASGAGIKEAAAAAGVTYMVAWHIKNSPDVWSNVQPEPARAA